KKLLNVLPVALVGFLIFCLLWYGINIIVEPSYYWIQQRMLAKELGVNIDDYPYPHAFPNGYFYSVLKPGMTIEQVHDIVKGYKKVFNCGDYEVYYYFSSSDSHALKFESNYDLSADKQDYVFLSLEVEDSNSRTIFVDGCTSGLLKP